MVVMMVTPSYRRRSSRRPVIRIPLKVCELSHGRFLARHLATVAGVVRVVAVSHYLVEGSGRRCGRGLTLNVNRRLDRHLSGVEVRLQIGRRNRPSHRELVLLRRRRRVIGRQVVFERHVDARCVVL